MPALLGNCPHHHSRAWVESDGCGGRPTRRGVHLGQRGGPARRSHGSMTRPTTAARARKKGGNPGIPPGGGKTSPGCGLWLGAPPAPGNLPGGQALRGNPGVTAGSRRSPGLTGYGQARCGCSAVNPLYWVLTDSDLTHCSWLCLRCRGGPGHRCGLFGRGPWRQQRDWEDRRSPCGGLFPVRRKLTIAWPFGRTKQ